MNTTNTIWRNCAAYPDRIAFLFDGRPIKYKTLRLGVELASARLSAAGVTRGEVVGLSIYNSLSYVTILLAVARLGAVAIPLTGVLSEELKEEMVAASHVQTIVLDRDNGWRSGNLSPSRHLEARMLLAGPVDGEQLPLPPVAQGLEGQPWLIALSSGTTGRPKRNPHTHACNTLMANLSPRVNHDDQERVFVFAPPGIQLGVNTIIQQLYRGLTTVLTRSTDPRVFYTVVRRDQPTRVVTTTGTASQLVAHAAAAVPDSSVICASIRSINIAGSSVSPALWEDITHRICSWLEVGYGATEAGFLAMSTPETRAVHPNSAGRLNPWVQAEAVDDNDQPLPHGRSGVLRFQSPLLTTGYLDDEEATATAFRNGWFYPGDTGSVGTAGYLFLGGRVDHRLNMGGNKIDPHLIEELLDSQPEIIESAVVAVNRDAGLPALVAVVEARAPFDSEALKRLCQERLGKMYRPHVILQVDALPRNESGKVMRSALAARIKIS
jgi:acyl-coenzyme A synthetase/AMP-(fatty) acid ligase